MCVRLAATKQALHLHLYTHTLRFFERFIRTFCACCTCVLRVCFKDAIFRVKTAINNWPFATPLVPVKSTRRSAPSA